MIHLAVGRGPSPLFGTAKLSTKKRRRKKSVALRKFWKVFVKVWDFCESFDPF